MHFVVTGGAGFIGSHLTQQLLSQRHYVTVIDDFSTGRLQNLLEHPRLRLIKKNVMGCIPEDFEAPIDGIAHLAAAPSVIESWDSPLEAHHNNLSATIAVINLCHRLKVLRLVFASSAAVYGDQISLPIQESQPTHPISPYGLQKLVSEQYASLFAPRLGFSFVALRMFNVFGPRQSPNSPYSGVISIFTKAMQQGLPITVFGDGTQTRDFVFVKDAAIAFAKALTTPTQAGSYTICNVGTGKPTSLNQLIEILSSYFPDWKAEVNYLPPRTGDIHHSLADVSRASSCLGFTSCYEVRSGLSNLLNIVDSID